LGPNAGRLVGGEIANNGVGPQNNPFGSQLFAGTTGTIVFYTEVREEFSDAHPSNDTSVDQGDVMNNFVDDPLTGARDGITGSQLNPATINAATPTVIGTGSDDSGSSIQIGYGTIEKQIYAVNGVVLPPQGSFADPITVQASDRVTYRLTYTLPLSSFEDLKLVDIPPLPVMDVDDATFSFTRNPAAYAFGAGEIGVLDPAGSGTNDDTYFATFDPTLAGARNPVISKNSTDNTVTMDFGTHEDIPLRRASQISLLITFPVSNDPFITDLFLTNQFRVTEASTNAGDTTAEGIRQIELVRPTVTIQKGAVAGDTVGLSTGNIAFAQATNATGTLTIGGNPLSSSNTLNSAAQASSIGGLNINATNAAVDAGDIVRYAIVAQNTGQGDAFDVQIRDQIQAGYVIPATFAGLNFRGFRGDGTPLVNGVDYNVVSYNNATGEFLIELVDNYTAGNLGGAAEDARSGALSRASSATLGPITNGSNSVIFLYDLTLTGTIAPNTSITNTATVPEYSNSEGGPDVTDPNELPDEQRDGRHGQARDDEIADGHRVRLRRQQPCQPSDDRRDRHLHRHADGARGGDEHRADRRHDERGARVRALGQRHLERPDRPELHQLVRNAPGGFSEQRDRNEFGEHADLRFRNDHQCRSRQHRERDDHFGLRGDRFERTSESGGANAIQFGAVVMAK
jgi:uncharacterized repeat protein (TIGR01451 family)